MKIEPLISNCPMYLAPKIDFTKKNCWVDFHFHTMPQKNGNYGILIASIFDKNYVKSQTDNTPLPVNQFHEIFFG